MSSFRIDVDHTKTLDEYLIEHKTATYLMTMKGESMVDEGIYDGDLLVIERGRSPRLGNIIVAEKDTGYTIRIFTKNNYSELKVIGVVRGIVRKYK